MLGKIPGIAKVEADKSAATAAIVYDKSIFDTSSLSGERGRYSFALKEDPATDSPEESEDDSDAEEESEETASSGLDFELDDLPSDPDQESAENVVPSLTGPSS